MTTEKQLQEGIRRHLIQAQHLHVEQFAAPGTHFQLRGAVPTSWPDLLIIVPVGFWTAPDGRMVTVALHFYFDCKTSRGKVSRAQEEKWQEMRDLGCIVTVVQTDSIDEGVRKVEQVLRDNGVVTLKEWDW